jgi:hypothetical protein
MFGRDLLHGCDAGVEYLLHRLHEIHGDGTNGLETLHIHLRVPKCLKRSLICLLSEDELNPIMVSNELIQPKLYECDLELLFDTREGELTVFLLQLYLRNIFGHCFLYTLMGLL